MHILESCRLRRHWLREAFSLKEIGSYFTEKLAVNLKTTFELDGNTVTIDVGLIIVETIMEDTVFSY